MKYYFSVVCIAALLFMGCNKSKNGVLLKEATVTVLHSTCVKTILKVENNSSVGVSWSDTTKTNPVVYQHVILAGAMKNLNQALEVSKQYKVKIYETATGPQVICYMLDAVNAPSAVYDVEFLP